MQLPEIRDLKISDELFAALFECDSHFRVLAHSDGTIIMANQKFSALTGFSASGVRGSKFPTFLAGSSKFLFDSIIRSGPAHPEGFLNAELALFSGERLTADLLVRSFTINDQKVLLISGKILAALKEPRAGSPPPPPRAERPSILVVDDDPIGLELARLNLGASGFIVDTADSGAAACEKAFGFRYDAILMDSHMPVMSGFEAAKKIIDAGITAPIIAMTASVFPEDRERCEAAGMRFFVPKPVAFDSLEKIILEAISARSRENAARPRKAAFNGEAFARNVSGKPRVAKEVIKLFIEAYGKYMAELRDAAVVGDAERLWKAAHRLKGTAMNVGAETLAGLFATIESRGRTIDAITGDPVITESMSHIDDEMARFREAIKTCPLMSVPTE